MDRYRLRWEDVQYEPGELQVVAYRDGQEIGRKTVRTASEPHALKLTPETRTMSSTGQSLTYILVEAIDKQGIPVPTSMNDVQFSVAGPATIAGIGNGDPMAYDPFSDDSHPLFYGKAMLIVRSKAAESGEIRISAQSDGLVSAQAVIRALPN